MTQITFDRGHQRWVSFHSEGHSGYAEAGKDIVCAGISAILQTAILGIQAYQADHSSYCIEEGYLECRLEEHPETETEREVQSIISTAALGCLNIAVQFPELVHFRVTGTNQWTSNKVNQPHEFKKLLELIK